MKKMILGCFLLSASSLASALNLDVQRDIFDQALILQEQNKWQQANDKLSEIETYPLAYLIEFNYLKANLDKVSEPDILSFIHTYKSKAVSNDLQRFYLFYLAEQKQWQSFLSVYPMMPNNPTLQCHYLQASIATGKSQQAWPDAKKIWLKSTSLANACDDVFVFYKNNNNLTQVHIWQRFQLAFVKNKQGLMRFLIQQMDSEEAKLAQQLYSLHKQPEKLLESHLFISRDSQAFALLVPSINRLANIDLKQAMQALDYFETVTPFTFKESVAMKVRFATIILQQDKPEYFQWLDTELALLNNVSLIEQRIRYAIKHDDWNNIDHWIQQLPETTRSSGRWLYWQARILERAGELDEAEAIYNKVAQKRSYHGFMAAQKLDLVFPFNADIVKEERGSLRRLSTELALIEELQFHQLKQQLKSQWRRLLNTQTAYLQQQLGLYAYDRGWAHLSVVASINSKSWSALNIRFPAAEPQLFTDAAKKYDLDKSYIYAITRRESSFDDHAKSPVGASGYMQLMPATAKETAREIGLREYNDVAQLKQGEINVQLGSAYFKSLLKRYDENRILATAAYNAGPSRVDKWTSPNKQSGHKGIDMDSWIESIPYRETRAYVQNVLVYNVIYQQVLNHPLKFVKQQELIRSY